MVLQLVSNSKQSYYPRKRDDLLNDPGWDVIIHKWIGHNLKFRRVNLGSKKLLYEFFEKGQTKFFGCLPPTGWTFLVAARCIITFIRYCGKRNKAHKLKLKRKREHEMDVYNRKILKKMR
jgi:hypothetical protein